MFSARFPSRLARPVSLLACRSASSFRSVFRVSPFFVSGGGAWGGAGVGWSVSLVGGRIGCLLGRCGAVLSRRGRYVYLFHCISFRGGFRCLDGCFRALMAACLAFDYVRLRAFPSALVHLVPFSLLACSLRGAGRLWRRASRLACLVAGTASMCVVSRVCPGCPCGCLPLPVCVVADEMRRTDGGGWALSCAVVACLPYCLAPLFDKGDGEGGGTNDDGRLRICGAAGR